MNIGLIVAGVLALFGIVCYKGVPWLLDLPKVEAERIDLVPPCGGKILR